MLRSLRVLLVAILVTLSLPVLRCDAQPAAAPAKAGQTPLKVEVRLQSASRQITEYLAAEATASPTATPAPTATPVPSPTPVPTPFSLYWISDTQVYAYRYPQVFNKVFAYVANACTEQNALGVLMTGDIVDNRNTQRHWNNAKAAIGLIEGRLPLWCVAGNHDVGATKIDYGPFLACGFCAADEGDQLYKDGVCWYDTFTAAGEEILLLGIGWQTDTAYLPWARTVLTDHPDLPAILLVHSFLTDKGGLTAMGKTLERELLGEGVRGRPQGERPHVQLPGRQEVRAGIPADPDLRPPGPVRPRDHLLPVVRRLRLSEGRNKGYLHPGKRLVTWEKDAPCGTSFQLLVVLYAFLPRASGAARPALWTMSAPTRSSPWPRVFTHWAIQCMDSWAKSRLER